MRALCDETGAALILDDVRAGFRLHLGGSWETVGVRPDLAAYSKAIANGYTLAAVTGSDKFRDAAASVFMTGSFWCGAASMAASLKTLEIFERDGTIATIARSANASATASPRRPGRTAWCCARPVRRRCRRCCSPTIPRSRRAGFSPPKRCAAAPGLHPQHNMFLSAAHTEADIDRALQATDGAMAAVRKDFGRE